MPDLIYRGLQGWADLVCVALEGGMPCYSPRFLAARSQNDSALLERGFEGRGHSSELVWIEKACLAVLLEGHQLPDGVLDIIDALEGQASGHCRGRLVL